jgi:hypothetical protein
MSISTLEASTSNLNIVAGDQYNVSINPTFILHNHPPPGVVKPVTDIVVQPASFAATVSTAARKSPDSGQTGFELDVNAAVDGIFTILNSAAGWSNVPTPQMAPKTVKDLLPAIQVFYPKYEITAARIICLSQDAKGPDEFLRVARHAYNLVSSTALVLQARADEGRTLPPHILENLKILTK